MTQADSVYSTPPTNTPIDTTRRRFLAQAAVVAAGGAAIGVALPLPVSAGDSQRVPDPIYAAIERHRAEQQAYADALVARDKLYETVPEEAWRGPRVQLGKKDGEPYYLHSHEQIDRRLEWMPDFGATPEIRARLHNELDRDITEWRAKRDEHGVTPAELRVEQACWSCYELDWAIATTVPTSLAGVAALLRYVNEREDGGEEWPDTDTIGSEGWHYQLRRTIAAALDGCANV
jgi:hypothetical protein